MLKSIQKRSEKEYIAHVRTSDGSKQSVCAHLTEVAQISARLAAKINAKEAGELVGLVHDFGKYSSAFQMYIRSATGEINQDSEDFVDSDKLKGKIDHSTAGAQLLWEILNKYGKNGEGRLCGQILALCVASHHSGLIDCLGQEGNNVFWARIKKGDERVYLNECQENAEARILNQVKQLADKNLVRGMLKQIQLLVRSEQNGQTTSETIKHFYIGFWTRFLFSCLIDADRINSADFENPSYRQQRNQVVSWEIAIERMEAFFDSIRSETKINRIRQKISDECKNRAEDAQGIYTLTVPTGGGKTYASLRYALNHARAHKLERIIFVIPYTSIIEQNAEAIRRVIERECDENPWILEHHSNLEPEEQTWRSKMASENWDAPIILTTMVQFLETLFSGGTRGVRRMHQLGKSVVIFDEVQTLPISCTHLFCNALNFLNTYASMTSVLCTATQPLLDKLKSKENGCLQIPKTNELIEDVDGLFRELKRVEISDKTKPEGWSEGEIAELALSELRLKGNCLVIVNTKSWAQALYQRCSSVVATDSLFHLSTNQCSAHRSELFAKMRARLDLRLPVLCFSTQLIEAGVDIDFASVIRFLAGLDSIAQASGRCNRNGYLETAEVHVVNPGKETIQQLVDIKEGQKQSKRVLSELNVRAVTLFDGALRRIFAGRFIETAYVLAESVYRGAYC